MITVLVRPAHFEQERCEVEGDAYRHLFRARRLAVGAQLRLVDGCGRARWAEVGQVERRRAILELGAEAPANEPGYRLHLLVAASENVQNYPYSLVRLFRSSKTNCTTIQSKQKN